MITLPKLADSIIQQVQSTRTIQSKFNTGYLYDIIHQTKNTVQALLYQKYQKINSAWTAQYVAAHDKDLQESTKFVRFALPTPAVTLGYDHSGIVYAGTKDGCQNFATVQTRGELNTYLNHRSTKKEPIILYSDTFLEVYNMALVQELLIDYIPANPTLLPTYNMDVDNYPLDDEGVSMLKTLVYQTITGEQAKAPVDYGQNMKDNTTALPTE